jgi:signal transduction histidine kinase
MQDQPVRILIVEDNESDYVFARDIIKRSMADCEAVWAERLETATAAFGAGRFDVILLDMGLPDSQGWSTLEAVHRQAGETPIIVLTGLEDEDTGMQAVEHGAQDYLTKMNMVESPRLLLRAIRYAMQRHQLQDALVESRLKEARFRLEKLESLGVLAGGIAHDFNNLLTGVIGNIALAKNSLPAGHEARHLMEEAERASVRATSLTRQLLAFAKGGNPVKSLTAVCDLVQECVTFALRGSNVKAEMTLPSNLWTAELDRGQVAQVIHNIVINAVQAMPQGGTLKVACENVTVTSDGPGLLSRGKYVSFAIRDEGTGIPKEHLSRLFDPYFTTKQKGSGLGLAIVHTVVQKHGGSVEVESVLGQGSMFRVYLPASQRVVPAQPVVPPAALAHARVLIMDDDDSVRMLLADCLRRQGVSVVATPNGTEAVAVYGTSITEGKPFDAVILDLTVPGGDGGLWTLAELSKLNPGVRAIVSSGYSTDPVLSDFRRYGFKAVLPKPYRPHELNAVLADTLADQAG